MPDATQSLWIERVLGMKVSPGAEPPGLRLASDAWRAAIEAVEAQIGTLQGALRASEDESLKKIADFGLNAVTGNHKVRLMAALNDVQAGGDHGKLAKIASSFRTFLEKDSRVAACDTNPFGVTVTIRATLVPVLEQMASL